MDFRGKWIKPFNILIAIQQCPTGLSNERSSVVLSCVSALPNKNVSGTSKRNKWIQTHQAREHEGKGVVSLLTIL